MKYIIAIILMCVLSGCVGLMRTTESPRSSVVRKCVFTGGDNWHRKSSWKCVYVHQRFGE